MPKKKTDDLLQSPQCDMVTDFTESLSFDRELYFWDIIGSLAHADALRDAGILGKDEHATIRKGLCEVLKDLNKGQADLRPELEDIHMNIEALLTDKIGPLAGKIHTGRSRNDQVSLDVRLYSRERIQETLEGIIELQKVLLSIAKKNIKTVMPGFTHMQPAQPVSLAHHMMAHWFKLQRDFERLSQCYDRVNICPLGSGALSGNVYNIDRFKVAESLRFEAPTENSMDAVSDRDFVVETIFCLTMIQLHLSSIAEEMIVWNTPQFRFISLSPDMTTGSSMMPQKRNPDVAELARGKTGRVAGDLMSLITTLKGLPLTYNRDLQEDKEPLFDAFDSAIDSLWAIRSMLCTATFEVKRMKEACMAANITATDLADYLVKKGETFRSAYSIVKHMVADAIDEGKPIEKWTLAEMKEHSRLFAKDALEYVKPEKALERRKIYGGTASATVENAMADAKDILRNNEAVMEEVTADVQGTLTRLLGPSVGYLQ